MSYEARNKAYFSKIDRSAKKGQQQTNLTTHQDQTDMEDGKQYSELYSSTEG